MIEGLCPRHRVRRRRQVRVARPCDVSREIADVGSEHLPAMGPDFLAGHLLGREFAEVYGAVRDRRAAQVPVEQQREERLIVPVGDFGGGDVLLDQRRFERLLQDAEDRALLAERHHRGRQGELTLPEFRVDAATLAGFFGGFPVEQFVVGRDEVALPLDRVEDFVERPQHGQAGVHPQHVAGRGVHQAPELPGVVLAPVRAEWRDLPHRNAVLRENRQRRLVEPDVVDAHRRMLRPIQVQRPESGKQGWAELVRGGGDDEPGLWHRLSATRKGCSIPATIDTACAQEEKAEPVWPECPRETKRGEP